MQNRLQGRAFLCELTIPACDLKVTGNFEPLITLILCDCCERKRLCLAAGRESARSQAPLVPSSLVEALNDRAID
jgi:hypothetical protein